MGPLLTPQEILDDAGASRTAYDGCSLDVLAEAARYVSGFLTQPHPALGRPGAVCPFAAGGLQRATILLTASPLRHSDQDALLQAVLDLRDLFIKPRDTSVRPADEIFRAIVVVFPHLESAVAASIIASVQKELKLRFVADGLMIGEFYPGCVSPGLHSAEFQPLDTTFCSLAIRRMTISDFPFMTGDDRFMSSYLQRFGSEGQKRLDSLLLRQAGLPEPQNRSPQSPAMRPIH